MEQHLDIWDVVLTPIFLLVLIAAAIRIRNKNYSPTHPLYKYYLPGILVKFAGAIFIALIYQFYYDGLGDSFNYFNEGKVINSSLGDSLATWLKLLFRVSETTDPYLYRYTSQLHFYTDAAGYSIGVISALFGLVTGNTYIPTALMFAFFAYTGSWAMFSTFRTIFPRLTQPLAIAFLFVPSTFVWGSAIYKDTVCMFGLGWLTYTTFQLFVYKNLSAKNLLLLSISFYLVAVIKVYILLSFMPALIVWLLMTYSHRIRTVALRWIVNIAFISITLAGFLFFANRYANELNRYSLERLVNTAAVTRNWINVSSGEEGSTYDLGPIEANAFSMISKFPAAVNVTLYRPYLWESRKPIMILSALESSAFLILTLMVFYRNGFFNTFRMVSRNPNLLFLAIFSIIFAFAVGVSTGNFGTLSRYKIPCLPFFAALLLILYYYNQPVKEEIKPNAKKRLRHFARL